ncbi:MAG: hypothetical protein ACFHVJ_08590 [Aestuariibacter sp.]
MEELFTKYTAAFDAFDAVAIAGLYRLPCAISDADGVQTYSRVSELTDKFAANCEAMRNFGYQSARFNLLEIQPLGGEQVAVNIGWCINTVNSSFEFRTLYLCHKVSDQWLIFSANVYPGSFSHTT